MPLRIDARVEATIGGREVGTSRLHQAYVGIEGLKLLTLAGAVTADSRIVRRPDSRSAVLDNQPSKPGRRS